MESRTDQRDLVIKVKYGDALKRFTASIYKNTLDQNMTTLKSKIIYAFNFPPNTDFILTYTDTDDDVVMLSDDEDLTDAAVKQRLNPLRITVQLKSNGSPASEPKSQSPNLNIPLGGLSASLEEALKSLPFSKLTEDIVSKATSGTVLTELLNVLSKLVVPQTTTQPVNNNEPEVPLNNKETKMGPPSDKAESSNARGGYNNHHRKESYFPNPPFIGPLPFIPPFSPICNRRNYEPPKFTSNNNNSNNNNNNNNNNKSLQEVHRGIICDGCDVTPILGARYKSIVKEDYDLCSACFSRMGNEADFIRLDQPVLWDFFQPPRYNNNNNNNNNNGPSWGSCPMRRATKQRSSKLESRFIQDVTVLDGTLMTPLTPFTKIWRMRNNGSVVWPFGTQLVWVGGDQFSSQISAELEVPVTGFPVNEEIDIAIDFTAPARAGQYISYWRLALPSGQKFGQRVWVLIQVEDPNNTDIKIKSTINLNLPPESNMHDAIEMMDINMEPTVETAPKPINPTNNIDVSFPQPELVVTEPVPTVTQPIPITVTQPVPGNVTKPETVVIQPVPVNVTQPETVVIQPVPVNVTQPELVTVHNAPNEHGSYPLIDLSPSPSNVSLVDPVPVKSETEEEILLKELEQMGFKQVDLNKEVLRLNKYDLEQSVEELCGFSEWDPLLEELKEMGFDDEETNKKLLMKNGGSINQVVMDLVAGEKAE